MKYFAPQQPDVASAIASLIKRLANRPNLTQSRHPVDVAVAKLTLTRVDVCRYIGSFLDG